MSSITTDQQNKQCKVEGCEGRGSVSHNGRRYLRHGYCPKHYYRVVKFGSTDLPVKTPQTGCSVTNCKGVGKLKTRTGRRHYELGLCVAHYQRQKRVKLPLYSTWGNMIQRCYYPASPGYKYYGGRGVRVCDEWRNSYKVFADYMGEKPTPEHTIDRIDTYGDYEPGNVRWATKQVQSWNRKKYSNNRSGVTGVYLDKKTSRWIASLAGKWLGIYDRKGDAIKARQEAERKLMSELN